MTEVKLFRGGEVNVFEEGARIIMSKDVIVSDPDGSSEVFIEKGTTGFVCSTFPQVAIEFDGDYGKFKRRMYLQDDLLITDLAELLDGIHLKVLEGEGGE